VRRNLNGLHESMYIRSIFPNVSFEINTISLIQISHLHLSFTHLIYISQSHFSSHSYISFISLIHFSLKISQIIFTDLPSSHLRAVVGTRFSEKHLHIYVYHTPTIHLTIHPTTQPKQQHNKHTIIVRSGCGF
jgi:hypothetical protein